MGGSSLFGSDSESDDELDDASAGPSQSQGFADSRTAPPPPRSRCEDRSSTVSPRAAPEGLFHLPQAIPIELQSLLVHNITTTLPLSVKQDQLMYFAHLPPALDPLLDRLNADIPTYGLPTEVLEDLLDRPDHERDRQAIINLYRPGMGIAPHVDLPHRYSSVILGISLLGTTVMDFVSTSDSENKFELVLRPGDVYILSGESRYAWTHAIEYRDSDWIEGEERKRGLRLSVTLRRMKEGGHVVG
ncbi:BZ3500_MvSof-1268-A1-R1_Chr5-1g07617 [Microbotryum saponariae]|uniref:BZ3500_MvSof-1268-A1-R1_Chr5-1g07617 protein n=1 Tax=Microbotryum saponariae TaxID=289078 RepID=A0A2X0LK33_9BASI|nr:BZ3500_MvSof-1268-A1-R1_Chr5-1g07617 [Microbotryum saponariae]SDA05488.1 BZ3501_MvSof-1269-A2-R1_Chr5-2g07441 [Microbotryum saponariae]